jgi:hypothetical protein
VALIPAGGAADPVEAAIWAAVESRLRAAGFEVG